MDRKPRVVSVQWPNSRILFRMPTVLLYPRYTRATCGKSKFYLRTMRGKVVSRSTGLRGGYEHPKRILQHTYVSPTSSLSLLNLFSLSRTWYTVVLKPNSTATCVLKGFFFSLFFLLFYTLQT